jgi:spore maturation protein SpmA
MEGPMGTREGLRFIATLIGGGFLVYAAVAVFRGTLHDVEDGRVDRAGRPVTFWLLVFSMTVLGLSILGVGWQWPIVGTLVRVIGPR